MSSLFEYQLLNSCLLSVQLFIAFCINKCFFTTTIYFLVKYTCTSPPPHTQTNEIRGEAVGVLGAQAGVGGEVVGLGRVG